MRPLLLLALVAGITAAEATPPAAPAPAATPAPAPTVGPTPPTAAEIAALTYDDVTDDNGFVTPFARDLSHNDEFPERKTDWENFLTRLNAWAPGKDPNVSKRVRNLLCASVLMDIGQGQFESELPLYIYQLLSREVPKDELVRILAMTLFHPEEGEVDGKCDGLDLQVNVGDDQVRERLPILAKKMLGRIFGKLPAAER
jgi:hypothetical protein